MQILLTGFGEAEAMELVDHPETPTPIDFILGFSGLSLAELKGSIGEGPNHSNHSNHSNSFKIQEFSLENSNFFENFNIF